MLTELGPEGALSDRCDGVELRVKARFESKPPVVRNPSGRAIVQCGSFGPK
jgi:hypothetical protein